jgi:hypothetical protein
LHRQANENPEAHRSHIVDLEDGSQWQIYPADLDLTLGWLPTTELDVLERADEISSHELIDRAEGTRVRVLPVGRKWDIREVKDILKDG